MKFMKMAAVIAVAFSLTSCLEKLPGDFILEEEGMKTLSDAEQTLTGIYTAYMSGALYSGYLTLCPDIQADLVYAVQGNTNTYGTLWQWDIRSTNSEIEAVYAALYRIIGRCNFYLDKVDGLRASLTDDAEIQYLDYYTGEVYCARALAYSELIKCFCKAYDPATAETELGVVLADSYSGEKPAKRASLKESYEFVINDLKKAEEMLDEENDGYDAPYFTNASAHAIHARTALYMQDWDAAVEHATVLVESDAFALASARSYVTADQTYLQYMWTNDASFEGIWRIGYTATSYGAAQGSVFLNFTTDYTYYYPDYVPAQWVLNLYSSGDMRYNAYFANAQTGYPHQLVWPLLIKYYGNEALMQNMIYHVNMPKPLRLAEQYLIRAEAYCRKGNYSAASADLTALREARFSTGGSISVNAGNWQETISDERVRELYMEGFRLHDLKRWGKGFERTPQSQTQSEGSSLKIEADDPLFVWPIPNHEIVSPGSQIQPNESNR
ncbi:MAG: RagB/SusD family nutrient uptake outer membrane protein [Bacteroidales bacterium]|nr:RagB/SusD family nutrient uptake outer membrane protein [Bacteroidales bacterium]MBQ8810507.1 RagB/SusD family nutrient uptake outer membrane protein [Bacteroidales bacterium]